VVFVEFQKRAKTSIELLEQLIKRGMVVADESEALRWIENVNYYRLTPYWLPYRSSPAEELGYFKPNTSFDDVATHYEFDRHLRTILFSSVERIEVSLRRTLSSSLTLNYGPFVHLREDLISNSDKWEATLSKIRKSYKQSKELFAIHHREKYPTLDLPPLWVAVELTSFGELRNLLDNLRHRHDRQAISSHYGLDETVFISLVKHLEFVRNTCAHHARVWNRKFAISPMLPREANFTYAAPLNRRTRARGYVYNRLVLLDFLESIILGEGEIFERVLNLLKSYPAVNRASMGFPN
jgi:abortive infection bacteriophage resistance protein